MLVVLREGCVGQTRKTAVYQIWVQCQQTGLCLLGKFEVYLHLPGKREYVSISHQEWGQVKLGGGELSDLKCLAGLLVNTIMLINKAGLRVQH